MKTLYLLRHAKAESGSSTLKDVDRPLSARGQAACMAIGVYMRTQHAIPALVVASPATRTQETAERVIQAMGAPCPCHFENKLYLASTEEIINSIQLVNKNVPSLMVVGHNPGMHQAALALVLPEETELHDTLGMKYPTGALAILQFDCHDWQEIASGSGKLMAFVLPKDLSNPA